MVGAKALCLLATTVGMCLLACASIASSADVIWLEAESFSETGGWSNDPQFVDVMGSPFLLATGLGKPVADAVTSAKVERRGTYRLWVRCRDWLPSHSPGRFRVIVGGVESDVAFGAADTDKWRWVAGGAFELEGGEVEVRLRDLTGWWGRCDAVVLAPGGFRPAERLDELGTQRVAHCGVTPDRKAMGTFDLVVVGGGPAGIGAALSAARGGLRVAFIQDRPVLGGNASSEIEIPPMGYIGNPPDKINVTGIAEEIFPKQGWGSFADSAKIERIVRAEDKIALFLNTRATGVEMAARDRIKAVHALDVASGQRMSFAAPLFADCTGHGWIGVYAGAEYRMGQEARAEFGESLAPVEPRGRTMGNSLYKAVFRGRKPPRPGAPSAPPAPRPETVVTHRDAGKVELTGDWTPSTYGDYLHDGNAGKGAKRVAFTLTVPKTGRYDVFLGYSPHSNRASRVPVTVAHAGGETSVMVDQRSDPGGWRRLGSFEFAAGEGGRVTISNAGTSGYVIADSVGLTPEAEGAKPTTAPEPEPLPDGVPFDAPEWVYQWRADSDFEPRGSHRRIREVRRPENFDAPSRGKGRNPGGDINGALLHAWWVEYGGMLDTVKDAEKIRDELMRVSLGLWNYAKNHNPATVAKNRYRELVWLNYVPGVRESRRLVGDYVMTQKDFDERILHEDTVAFTDWGIDVHHPEGFWVRGNDCIHVYHGRRVSIPYRTLYSRNIANLFMAGRCHSATHIALGGTRVMRPMCATGQAAGTAAAIARKRSAGPRGVHEKHVKELQQTLLRDGCYLLGVPNADDADLALGGEATASSSAPGAEPENAINGWNRVVGRDRNAWAPAKGAAGPHRLEIELAAAADVAEVHVTFEEKSVPCRVEGRTGAGWQLLGDIAPHAPRRNVLRFAPVKALAVRIVADAAAPAVCEVRAYE